MAVVQSLGVLADMQAGWLPLGTYGRLRMYDQFSYDYATLYRTQPNVRTCVDFLARNVAQLGLHVFRRVSETDRERLRDHPLAQVLARPLPAVFKVTRYRLIESLLADLGVYFNAYWLKVRANEAPLGLLRIPPPFVDVKGGLVPTGYEINLGGQLIQAASETIVHFRGYNADNAFLGLSPLETLRRVLAEEHAMGDYREYFWRNAARMGGIIERPATAPDWSDDARNRFRQEFEALYSGTESSGKTAVLEEGMEWKAASFNAQQSEYLGARKLTREECARAYHIPLPMVGILDHASFSNIREQHKNLYQDALGPWLAMIEQEIELQLLPEFEDVEGVYCEFNIQEKLSGSFEEQTKALQAAVGRPWMTANEARGRMNLPSLSGDAEQLVTPLNVLVGGQASPRGLGRTASPRDRVPEKAFPSLNKVMQFDPTLLELRERHERQWEALFRRTYERQRDAVLGRIPEDEAKAAAFIQDLWDAARWNRELRSDIYGLNVETATTWARYVAEALDFELDEERMLPFLDENARIAAEEINASTRDRLAQALTEDLPREAVKAAFVFLIGTLAWQIARTRVTTAANFGAHEAARQGQLRTKTWKVNSKDPRDWHAVMDGETVGIGELFSNGMRWPGDPAGGAENNANCRCSVGFGQ